MNSLFENAHSPSNRRIAITRGAAITHTDSVQGPRSVRLGLLTLGLIAVVGCTMPAPIRVMSFNIRYGTAQDGENNWPQRRKLVFETIRAFEPDVLGLQEVLAFQRDELIEALPEYYFVGVGRTDGELGGEFAPIMIRKKPLNLLDSGVFWLSDKPDKIGSRGWDAALPRIVT